MKQEDYGLRQEAGDRNLHPQKVVDNVIGRQHKIGQELLEEYVE